MATSIQSNVNPKINQSSPPLKPSKQLINPKTSPVVSQALSNATLQPSKTFQATTSNITQTSNTSSSQDSRREMSTSEIPQSTTSSLNQTPSFLTSISETITETLDLYQAHVDEMVKEVMQSELIPKKDKAYVKENLKSLAIKKYKAQRSKYDPRKNLDEITTIFFIYKGQMKTFQIFNSSIQSYSIGKKDVRMLPHLTCYAIAFPSPDKSSNVNDESRSSCCTWKCALVFTTAMAVIIGVVTQYVLPQLAQHPISFEWQEWQGWLWEGKNVTNQTLFSNITNSTF